MKILIIVPHTSTGGCPQVALKRVEYLKRTNNEVYVIEYRQIAWRFVVQRNKLIEILGDNFISLGNVWGDGEEIRDKFEEIVTQINPDLIHMEEIPEKFIFGMRKEHSDWLYREDRTYKIIETTHTSTFDVNNKVYFPDKFIFMSAYSAQEYSKFNIPYSVVEYPVEKLEVNKTWAMEELKFETDYFHILNIGLFTRDKNQGYLFEIAKKLKEYKIHFHFVGNQAENFADYWEPLINNKLDNCFVYGEREDVDKFYQASDLVVHPSILELNPLAIKEATSYNLPVYLNNLTIYLNMYDSYKNVKYLTMNLNGDVQMILDNFNIRRKDDNSSFGGDLIKEYDDVFDSDFKDNPDDYIEYNISFLEGAKVEILGNTDLKFDVEILDDETNKSIYNTTLGVNGWGATNIRYYLDYKINIKHNDKLLIAHKIDLNDKNVLIQFDSKSMGDTLAWIPYVEEFRKKHNCNIYCSTFWNNFFIGKYSDIIFIKPGDSVQNLYARYTLGWYQPIDFNRNPIDYRKQPMQKAASDILGLEYKEIKPDIRIPDGVRPIEEKYVCVAQFSTANTKHWQYPCKNSNKGWQMIVDWLNAQGYKVMVISKQKTKLKNIIDKTGDFPIEHRINELKHCEFYIGVGSGLSWLAWAIGKKVVMISGFSNPICEFQSNNINVHNYNVCNGCFNRHFFDRGDWNWCPEHKNTDRQFECSINITPKMITDRIINSKLIENPIPFDFDKYDVPITLDENDITLSYEKDKNKIIISYNNEDTPPLFVDFKNPLTKETYHSIVDFSLSKNFNVWSVPNTILHEKTDKILVSFYERNKILDIEFEL